jgi:hypothetical protein
MAGNEFAFIEPVVAGTLDSVPSDQYVRVGKLNSNELNFAKAAPNQIDIVHEWNVGEMSGQFYSNWHKNVKLEAADRPDLQGGKQNVVGCDDKFLDYLQSPVAPAKAGVPFKFVADQNLILAEYYYDDLPPGGPNPLNITFIQYGFDNYSGQKIEASWLEAGGDTINWARPVSPIGGRHLRVLTDRPECIASDGKIILGTGWIRNQVFLANGVRGPVRVGLSNCKLYLDDWASIFSYNAIMNEGWGVEYFITSMGFVYDNIDVILELPPGKEAFGTYGQVNKAPKGKTHTSQPANRY